MSSVRRRVFNPGDQADHKVDTQEAREMRKLTQRMGELERDVASLARDMGPPAPRSRDDSGPVNVDARWHCKKCGYLLGFYDVENDVLRTRYKEHIVFVRCGDGGFVQVVCRGCSEVNTATGEGKEQPQGPRG